MPPGRSRERVTYVDGLGVVAKPIAKVDALDVHLGEFLAVASATHQEGEQSVFNVSMAPILALDLGRGGDVASSEGMRGAGQQDEQQQAREEEKRGEPKGRHGGRSVCVNSTRAERAGTLGLMVRGGVGRTEDGGVGGDEPVGGSGWKSKQLKEGHMKVGSA